jgi:hypothetical protein
VPADYDEWANLGNDAWDWRACCRTIVASRTTPRATISCNLTCIMIAEHVADWMHGE